MYQTEFTQTQLDDVRNAALVLVKVFKNKIEAYRAYTYAYNENEAEIISRVIELTGGNPGKISTTNSKLNELAKFLGVAKTQVVAFDLLAGKSCPFADICKAWVEVDANGKRRVVKGDNCEFTCYAAGLEGRYTNVFEAHDHNQKYVDRFCQVKAVQALAAWLVASIWYKSPTMMRHGGYMRWHASGDFHKATYTNAASLVQQVLTNVQFFGYSKSPWVVQALTNGKNAHMVHSHGSKFDDKAVEMGLPQSFVQCYDGQYDVPLACQHPTNPDDYVFIKSQVSFAIKLH